MNPQKLLTQVAGEAALACSMCGAQEQHTIATKKPCMATATMTAGQLAHWRFHALRDSMRLTDRGLLTLSLA
jgi:hypothetical protein